MEAVLHTWWRLSFKGFHWFKLMFRFIRIRALKATPYRPTSHSGPWTKRSTQSTSGLHLSSQPVTRRQVAGRLPVYNMTYFLIAESAFAKTFQGPHGPDIIVGDDTRIGRSVTGRDACRLPAKWAQVSGNHCKIFYTSLKVHYFMCCTSRGDPVELFSNCCGCARTQLDTG